MCASLIVVDAESDEGFFRDHIVFSEIVSFGYIVKLTYFIYNTSIPLG